MIVLDTNQLEHVAFPHGAVLGMLRKIAELQQQSLAIPEMVVVEHVAHYRHRVEQALTTARKALATLDKAFDQDLLSHPLRGFPQMQPPQNSRPPSVRVSRSCQLLPEPLRKLYAEKQTGSRRPNKSGRSVTGNR
ncbi:hypothetical protein [Streptomyces sp. XD-27]|uniref:hypothetical protein n=1 Tax=Streptomyces sp. XD-27 TaxID=3062779 RepID=UPI0026F438BE|nr:hypothetical protein [Streptomyces sp. XD-27]WKX69407.1 hypothetical protein Q3Y56_05295 [Streptomyces sp. XD-27]